MTDLAKERAAEFEEILHSKIVIYTKWKYSHKLGENITPTEMRHLVDWAKEDLNSLDKEKLKEFLSNSADKYF